MTTSVSSLRDALAWDVTNCVLAQDAAISYASVVLEGPRLPPGLRKAKLLPPKQAWSLRKFQWPHTKEPGLGR